jgi:hypothetical protein
MRTLRDHLQLPDIHGMTLYRKSAVVQHFRPAVTHKEMMKRGVADDGGFKTAASEPAE